jgi:outer membrane receptor for ferrienterochelin and colicins
MLLATVDNDYRPTHSPWFSIENIQMTKKFKNGIEIFGGVKNFLNFIEKDPILRAFDPFNRNVNVNNPNGYRFDTTYGYSPLEGVKGFIGIRYTLK